jgi:hypothetical protein
VSISTLLVFGLLLSFDVQPLPPATGAVGRVSDVTFEGYFTKLEQIRDLPLEPEAYAQSLAGCRVRWDGHVAAVTPGKGAERPHLMLLATRNQGDGRVARVVFPRTFRTKLSSLRTGARVRVSGTLDLSSVYFPLIDEAESIEAIAAATPSTKRSR